MAKKSKVQLDADLIVKRAIEEARGYYAEYKQYPTLRGIYYRLVSTNVIPNVRSAYQRLSVILSRARKQGTFPWNYLVDNSGRYISESDTGYELSELREHPNNAVNAKIAQIIKYLQSATSKQINLPMSRWTEQPNYVICTVEKDAMASAVRSILDPLGVSLVVMKGYSSVTQIHDLAERLRLIPKEKAIHILQLTDYDPSGEDIARNLSDQLIEEFGIKASVEKIAVTLDQINDFSLRTTPNLKKNARSYSATPDSESGNMDFSVLNSMLLLQFDRATLGAY